MAMEIPDWALRRAGPSDRLDVQKAVKRNRLVYNWYEVPNLKQWARSQGWPTPWLTFSSKFLETMLANDENYALVLSQTDLVFQIPKKEYSIDDSKVAEFDKLYQDREFSELVDELRDIRRAVYAGVKVLVDGRKLMGSSSFYNWAHGRYYLLEDDPNSGWIGDDSPNPWYR